MNFFIFSVIFEIFLSVLDHNTNLKTKKRFTIFQTRLKMLKKKEKIVVVVVVLRLCLI